MLNVETGAGLTDSNTYASLDEASSYHAARGNVEWTAMVQNPAVVPLLEKNLVIATEAINTLYGKELKGDILTNEQAQLYPRTAFTDGNGRAIPEGIIPQALKHATALLALKLQNEEVTAFPRPNNASAVVESSLTTGKYQKTTKYAGTVVSEKYIGYGDIENILAPLMGKEAGKKKSSYKLGF